MTKVYALTTTAFVLALAACGDREGLNPAGPTPLQISSVPSTVEAPQSVEVSETVAFGPAAATTSSTGRTISGVKFAPQVPPGSWSKTMSCGPAALNMAAAYLWGVTPDQATYIPKICKYLGKTDIYNCLPGGTSTTNLVSAAKAINSLPATYKDSGWDLPRIRQQIDNGRPVVVAVRAGDLLNRGYSYSGGHFVLVVGYDSGNMVVHDPGTKYGAFKKYSSADFTRAMNSSGGAVVVPRRW